jgi:hypothetical protein
MLGDALQYVYEVMNSETKARLELVRKLAKGEILSRALTLRIADRRVDITQKNWVETKKFVDLPTEFWIAADIKVSWSENWARSTDVDRLVVERATEIEVRRDDIFRLWPPLGVTASSGALPSSRLANVSQADLTDFLETRGGTMIESDALAAAKKGFPDHKIPRSLWRCAWKTLSSDKKRKRGDNARTLKSKSAD